MRKASLFSGIGGIDLAAHWAGMETVVFCEREPFPQKVLRKHWPDVPIIDDVHDFTAGRLEELGIGTIDLISAGYPCQPFSHAGQRRGAADDRHLWPEVKRVLGEIRPRWFVGENVAGHISLGLDTVLADLEELSYACWPIVLPAAAVYAQHRRDRVFIVAYSNINMRRREERARAGSLDSQVRKDLERERHSERHADKRCSQNVADTEVKRRNNGEDCPDERTPYRKINSSPNASTSSSQIMADASRERCGKAREHCRRSEKRSAGRSPMADTSSQGLQERRRPGRAESGKETGTGPIDRFERCSEALADSNSGRHKLQEEQICSGRNGFEHCGIRTTQPGMGRSPYELSEWLDGRGINPLDALQELIANYPQPAPMGMAQYEWEPPRVAKGVKNRTGRLKALGNAVDPLQIYPIMQAIKWIDEAMS